MRKALIVGIDHYEDAQISNLNGCVNDAHGINSVLERNADGTLNFAAPRLLLGSDSNNVISKPTLKRAVRQLFADASEIALLYFAGRCLYGTFH